MPRFLRRIYNRYHKLGKKKGIKRRRQYRRIPPVPLDMWAIRVIIITERGIDSENRLANKANELNWLLPWGFRRLNK